MKSGAYGRDHCGYEAGVVKQVTPTGCSDLRGWIASLSAAGRLKHITEPVDWRLDLARRAVLEKQPVLFEQIHGYPGHRLMTNGLCDAQTIALALGMSPDTDRTAMTREARHRLSHPIQPQVVEDAPFLENRVEGSQLSLFDLPVPQWNPIEAGRYIGTWHLNITRNPETGRRNVGVYRMQILGPDTATVSTSAHSHLGRHMARAEQFGRPLPMAVVIGAPEAAVIAAAAGLPEGVDELDVAGGLLGAPLEVVTLPGGPIQVPAASEFVLEGEIEPHVRVSDGPYFDYTGMPNTNPRAYLFHVRRLWFRNQPIFRGTAVGHPGAEDHQLFAFLAELGLVDFHGSRLKRLAQNQLLKFHAFRSFQIAGSLGSYLRPFQAKELALTNSESHDTKV